MSFRPYFASVFEVFGYPLAPGAALAPRVLEAAEARLGLSIPTALREFYLIAGRERRFGSCLHRFLPPSAWFEEGKRIVFMQENQSIGWWGVSVRNPGDDDPSVSLGMDNEPIRWQREHRHVSVFLAVMLHYQAVNGGLRFTGTAESPEEPRQLAKRGWKSFGRVNSMRAFSRPGQVVCLMPPPGEDSLLPRWMPKHWTIHAGGKTQRDLSAIGEDLGLSFS